MKTEEIVLNVPNSCQLILGQAHFIKSVEDIYEAVATSMPGVRFGVAFCEASAKALVRTDGSDKEMVAKAREFALQLRAGHSFVVVLTGAFPINVLNRLKNVEEVAGIYCATSNRVTVIVADTGEGRGILGVVDGVSTRGSETDEDRKERQEFLRKIGYKR